MEQKYITRPNGKRKTARRNFANSQQAPADAAHEIAQQ